MVCFASKVKRLCKEELSVVVWFFCTSVNFFSPVIGACAKIFCMLLWLCVSDHEDLAVHGCMALRMNVSVHSYAMEVPCVPRGRSYLGTEEWGPIFGFESTALNQTSLNTAHIRPKSGDCLVNSVWICACVCLHHCLLFHSRTAAQDSCLDGFELCTKTKVNKCTYTSSDLNCSVKIWATSFWNTTKLLLFF